MEEHWKDIKDFEGLYQVSNWGRVKSLKWGKEKIMTPRKDRGGYLQVHLCKDGKQYMKLAHRLVAQHFIDNPNNLPEVNHKDENKQNNHFENLEWCTRAHNNNYGSRNERVAKVMTNGKRSKAVLQLNLDGISIKEWPSVNEVKRQLGFNKGNISRCCNGHPKYSHVHGFIWRYKND